MLKGLINCTVYTCDGDDKIIKNGGLLYAGDKLIAVDTNEVIMALGEDAELIDGQGAFVFPGLINTHTHLYQSLLKGLGSNLNLEAWWPKVIGPAGMALTKEHVVNGVNHGLCEALKSGVTTVVDFMQFHLLPGLAEAEIEAVGKLGVRLIYGRGFRDAGEAMGFSEMNENIDAVCEAIISLKQTYENEDGMVSIWLAPAAIWTYSDKGLEKTRQFATETKTPIMMHLFETQLDDKICLDRYGMKAMNYYLKCGFLGPDVLAVHSVALTTEALATYRDYGIKVSHNPVSNMYLGSGTAPIIAMRQLGIPVGLGTDGAASNNSNDMLETLKTTVLLHRNEHQNAGCIDGYDVLKMATIEGAKAIGMDHLIGSLEAGKKADFFLFDPYLSFKTSPVHNGLAALIYSGDYKGIKTVVINGKTVLEKGCLTTGDETIIMKKSMASAKILSKSVAL